MYNNLELYDFLVKKLIYSDYHSMYDVIQFCSEMVMQEYEYKQPFPLLFDSDDKALLHQKMCDWFNKNILDTICLIKRGVRDEQKEKSWIKKAIRFRAEFLVKDIESGRLLGSSEKQERRTGEEDRREEQELELEKKKGQGQKQERSRSSAPFFRGNSGVLISSASPEQQDKVFSCNKYGPERSALLNELFHSSGKLSLNDLCHSFREKDPGISPTDLRAYLNSLEDADAGSFSPQIRSFQSIIKGTE